jgi:hypothetical protein
VSLPRYSAEHEQHELPEHSIVKLRKEMLGLGPPMNEMRSVQPLLSVNPPLMVKPEPVGLAVPVRVRAGIEATVALN